MEDVVQYTDDNELVFIDQSLLPHKEKYIRTDSYKDIIDAINERKINGGSLISVVSAYGIVLAVLESDTENKKNLEIHFSNVLESFKKACKYSKNVINALRRMETVFHNSLEKEKDEISVDLLFEADQIYDEETEITKRMAINGSDLLSDGMNILTYGNSGELSSAGIGTALGVIITAGTQSKELFAYVCETRPLFEGSRLAAYELNSKGIDNVVIGDSFAATLMSEDEIDCVMIGAETCAANGDVIVQTGGYNLAILAAYHKIPFYCVCPTNAYDYELENLEEFKTEEDDEELLRYSGDTLITDKKTQAAVQLYEKIPGDLITAIVNEHRVYNRPYSFGKRKAIAD